MVASPALRVFPILAPPTTSQRASSPRLAREPPRPPPAPTAETATDPPGSVNASKDSPALTAACRPFLSKLSTPRHGREREEKRDASARRLFLFAFLPNHLSIYQSIN